MLLASPIPRHTRKRFTSSTLFSPASFGTMSLLQQSISNKSRTPAKKASRGHRHEEEEEEEETPARKPAKKTAKRATTRKATKKTASKTSRRKSA